MQFSGNTILLVDDEKHTRQFVSNHLAQHGFTVLTSDNGFDAIEKAQLCKPSIILLDIMMPGMDGIETCIELRKLKNLNNTAIAFLSGRGEDYTQIAGFEAGADDFIVKPIHINLLIKRLKALLKRVRKTTRLETEDKALVIDPDRFTVTYRGAVVPLTRKEFEILQRLHKHQGKTIPANELFEHVWRGAVSPHYRTIHVHISRIRQKLSPELIQTVKGFGYRLKHPVAD